MRASDDDSDGEDDGSYDGQRGGSKAHPDFRMHIISMAGWESVEKFVVSMVDVREERKRDTWLPVTDEAPRRRHLSSSVDSGGRGLSTANIIVERGGKRSKIVPRLR